MKAFAALYRELDATTSSLAKQAALQRYLLNAQAPDAAWAVYFLAGGKPRQLVPTKILRALAVPNPFHEPIHREGRLSGTEPFNKRFSDEFCTSQKILRSVLLDFRD